MYQYLVNLLESRSLLQGWGCRLGVANGIFVLHRTLLRPFQALTTSILTNQNGEAMAGLAGH